MVQYDRIGSSKINMKKNDSITLYPLSLPHVQVTHSMRKEQNKLCKSVDERKRNTDWKLDKNLVQD